VFILLKALAHMELESNEHIINTHYGSLRIFLYHSIFLEIISIF